VLKKIHFFESSQEVTGLFDSFFGGVFLVKGLPLFLQLTLILLVGIGFWGTCRSKRVNALLSIVALFISAVLLFQAWDELFIYLKHAENLALHGTYSFKAHERVDGIVDFLPFFILGLIGKTGLPLLETNFLLGVLGAWLCVLVCRRFLLEWEPSLPENLTFFLPLMYPPLLLNSGTGFSVLLFSSAILWSLYYLIFRPKSIFGFLILSWVPLIRFEGLFFSFLMLVYFFSQQAQKMSTKRIFALLFISFFPVGSLIFWRWAYFGRILPIPIIYKSSFGNLFYSLLGLRNLLMDLVATGALFFLFFIFKNKPKSQEKSFLMILALFCFPYYLSGGDWFPPAWGRYLFPFCFFCFIFALKIFLGSENRQYLTVSNALGFVFFLLIISFPFSSSKRVFEGLLSHRSSLSGIHQKKWGKVNFRTHTLSQLGTHLKATTPSHAVIGSSEIATIMYFAGRETLDLLGVTNKDIAFAPLRSSPDFNMKFSGRNELPYLIFKRLNPDLIYKERPYIFYAFDFIPTDLIELSNFEIVSVSHLKRALSIWEKKFERLNSTLFGGLEKLLKNGYEPVLIKRGERFYSLYFINSDKRDEHFSLMRNLGMSYMILQE